MRICCCNSCVVGASSEGNAISGNTRPLPMNRLSLPIRHSAEQLLLPFSVGFLLFLEGFLQRLRRFGLFRPFLFKPVNPFQQFLERIRLRLLRGFHAVDRLDGLREQVRLRLALGARAYRQCEENGQRSFICKDDFIFGNFRCSGQCSVGFNF